MIIPQLFDGSGALCEIGPPQIVSHDDFDDPISQRDYAGFDLEQTDPGHGAQ
jgi:hypothetical protein